MSPGSRKGASAKHPPQGPTNVTWEGDQSQAGPLPPPPPPGQGPLPEMAPLPTDDDVFRPLESGHQGHQIYDQKAVGPEPLAGELSRLREDETKLQAEQDERMLTVVSKLMEVRIRKGLLKKVEEVAQAELKEERDELARERKALEDQERLIQQLKDERVRLAAQARDLAKERAVLDAERDSLRVVDDLRREHDKASQSIQAEREYIENRRKEHAALTAELAKGKDEAKRLAGEREKVLKAFNTEKAADQISRCNELLEIAQALKMDTADLDALLKNAEKAMGDGDPVYAHGFAREFVDKANRAIVQFVSSRLEALEKGLADMRSDGEPTEKVERFLKMTARALEARSFQILPHMVKETQSAYDVVSDLHGRREEMKRLADEVVAAKGDIENERKAIAAAEAEISKVNKDKVALQAEREELAKRKDAAQLQVKGLVAVNRIAAVRTHLRYASELGANTAAVKEKLTAAEGSLKAKKYDEATKAADECANALEKLRYETIVDAIREAKKAITEARSKGVPTDKADEIYSKIQPHFDKKEDHMVVELARLARDAVEISVGAGKARSDTKAESAELKRLTDALDAERSALKAERERLDSIREKAELATVELKKAKSERESLVAEVKTADARSQLELLESESRATQRLGIDLAAVEKAMESARASLNEGQADSSYEAIKAGASALQGAMAAHVQSELGRVQSFLHDTESMGVDVARATALLDKARERQGAREYTGALALANLAEESGQVAEQLFMVNKVWESTRSLVEHERQVTAADRQAVQDRKSDIKRMRGAKGGQAEDAGPGGDGGQDGGIDGDQGSDAGPQRGSQSGRKRKDQR